MPSAMVQVAKGHNPQSMDWVRRQAFTLRVHKRKSYAFIGRALASHRQGKMEGVPYHPTTIHGWVAKALELEQPKDKKLRQQLQKQAEMNYDSLYEGLTPLITPHGKKCPTCSRSPQEADPVAVGQARQIVESRCKLLGLNEPAVMAVHNLTRETLDTYSDIVKTAAMDYLPVAQADGFLLFLERRICEASGEAPPADMELKAEVLEA